MTEENYETVFFLVTSTLITLFTVAQGLLKTDQSNYLRKIKFPFIKSRKNFSK